MGQNWYSDSPSYWEQVSWFSNWDLIIVGGGLVGMATAVEIRKKRPNWRILILERGPLPAGASTRNAGFACFGSVGELLANDEEQGVEHTNALMVRRFRGLELLRKTLGDKAIGYEACGGHEPFFKGDEEEMERVHRALPEMNQRFVRETGREAPYSWVKEAEFRSWGFSDCIGVVRNQLEGGLDSGLLTREWYRRCQNAGITMLQGVEIERVEGAGPYQLVVAQGNRVFTTERVLLCTNGLTRSVLPHADVLPARGQVLVTKEIPDLPWKGVFHYQKGYYYFRNLHGRVLLGGARHLDKKGEETPEMGEHKGIRAELRRFLTEQLLPVRAPEVQYEWSGIMGFGSRMAPLIEQTPSGIYLAVRGSGMGVALSMGMAGQVSQLIAGKD